MMNQKKKKKKKKKNENKQKFISGKYLTLRLI